MSVQLTPLADQVGVMTGASSRIGLARPSRYTDSRTHLLVAAAVVATARLAALPLLGSPRRS